ncbi:polysaccharide lyase family 8 super-sandwich domain-containing protein [Lactococcus garvieae]|uniref:polysaccharide lyase family 8 super-sandwich domain-containing protein n=1 Tax=Lactococcus garvieae TaxID=1363 RepID=UPI00385205E8
MKRNKVISMLLLSTTVLALASQTAVGVLAMETVPETTLVPEKKTNENPDLFAGKSVTYSGVEGGKVGDAWKYPQFAGEKAVDSDDTSRWSADKKDDQWLVVDMGEQKTIRQLVLNFFADSPSYEVFVSSDKENWTSVYSEDNGVGGKQYKKVINIDTIETRYVKYQQKSLWLHANGQRYSSSLFSIEGYEKRAVANLLLNQPVEYSGVEGGKVGDEWKYPQFVGEKAVDGDTTSRWSADKADKQWLIADMGNEQTIRQIILNFQHETTDYEIFVSSDKENWTSVHKEITGSQGDTVSRSVEIEPTKARYIKYQQNKMWKNSGNGQFYGSSLLEVAAYEDKLQAENIEITNGNVTVSKHRTHQLNVKMTPLDVIVAPEDLTWTSSDESVATVDANGKVRALAPGQATITVALNGTELSTATQITVSEENEQFALMRNRWKERLLGAGEFSDDKDVQAYIDLVSKEGQELWDSLHKEKDRTTLWDKLPSDVKQADYTTQFTKLKMLTLAYYMNGTTLYHKPEVKEEIIKALDFMVDVKQYDGYHYIGGWWDYQIGVPHQMSDILILLHDDLLVEDYDRLEKFVNPIKIIAYDPGIQYPSVTATGANLADIALSVLGGAILTDDAERVALVQEKVPTIFKKVTSGDGIYEDGSFVQHHMYAYTGSYGADMVKGVGRAQDILKGTEFEMTEGDFGNFYNWIEKGYLNALNAGKTPAMLSGRSVTRAPGTNNHTTEFESGKETIHNLLVIAESAPEELRNKIYAHVKAWIKESGEYFNFYNDPRDFGSIINLKSIMEDDSIKAGEDREITNIYASMDKVIQKANDFAVDISMYSSRIANFEYGNNENKRGWHTGDGMVNVHNGDFKQFDEGYFATVDAKRMPGTTVDAKDMGVGETGGKKSPQNWVGGTTNGEISSVGMFLDKTNQGMDLKAKKSWFMLDNMLVNMGAGITGTSSKTIETVLDNRMIDKEEDKITDKSNEGWININSSKDNGNIGYIFPESMGHLESKVETRTGSNAEINDWFPGTATYSKDYFTLVKDHGNAPINDNYEYVTVSGKSDNEMKDLAKDKGYEVLANNENIQAIQAGDKLMANVWTEHQVVAGIKANNQMSYIVEKTAAGTYKITMSNPRMTADKISLDFGKNITSIVKADEGVSVEGNTISLDSSRLRGASRSVTVKVALTDEEIKDITSFNQCQKHDKMLIGATAPGANITVTNPKGEKVMTSANEKGEIAADISDWKLFKDDVLTVSVEIDGVKVDFEVVVTNPGNGNLLE